MQCVFRHGAYERVLYVHPHKYLLVERCLFVVDDARRACDLPRSVEVLCRACGDHLAFVMVAEELRDERTDRTRATDDEDLRKGTPVLYSTVRVEGVREYTPWVSRAL